MKPSAPFFFSFLPGLILVSAGQAAIVFNPADLPFFTTAPNTQTVGVVVAPVGPGLVLSPTATGFTIVGQVTLTMPAGPVSGTFDWEVRRPIDTTNSTGPAFTTTALTGFITAPAGALAGAGVLQTEVIHNNFNGTVSPLGGAGFTLSTVPFSHAAGPGTTNYPPPGPSNSANFPYTPLPSDVDWLEQTYSVSFSYNGPAGGTYLLDFPAESSITAVPEPGTALLAVVALLGMAAGSRRRPRPSGQIA